MAEKKDNSKKLDLAIYPLSMSLRSYEGGLKQYEVEYPDFPYVVGAGDTPEEATREAQENLRLVLEDMVKDGESVPQPAVFDSSKEPSGKITVRMTKSLHRALIRRSQEERMSLNSVVVDAISAYVYQIKPTFPSKFADWILQGNPFLSPDYFSIDSDDILKMFEASKEENKNAVAPVCSRVSYPAPRRDA